MKKIILLLIFTTLCWQEALAQSFTFSGLNYEVISPTAVSVGYQNQSATGAVTIPAQVTFNSAVYSVTSIGNNAFEKNKISVYPNPAKNKINLQFLNNVKADKIVISDLNGKIILEQTIGTNQVDVSQIANGMYILQAFSGKDKYQSKFIKE